MRKSCINIQPVIDYLPSKTPIRGIAVLVLTALVLTGVMMSSSAAYAAGKATAKTPRKNPNEITKLTEEVKIKCGRVLTLPGNIIYKAQASKHIPRSDRRSKGASLVFLAGAKVPKLNNVAAYNSRGVRITQFPKYASSREYPWRGYSGSHDKKSPQQIKAEAKSALYLKVEKNLCYIIPRDKITGRVDN